MIRLALYSKLPGNPLRTFCLKSLSRDIAIEHGGTRDGISYGECSCVHMCITITGTCSVSVDSQLDLFTFTSSGVLWER